MGKKGYALVEAVTAVALVMMASGILSLGISFGLRMERRAEQLKDTDTVQEVPARFRMRTWDGTVISGEAVCAARRLQAVTESFLSMALEWSREQESWNGSLWILCFRIRGRQNEGDQGIYAGGADGGCHVGRSGAFDRPSLDAHGPADCPQAVR